MIDWYGLRLDVRLFLGAAAISLLAAAPAGLAQGKKVRITAATGVLDVTYPTMTVPNYLGYWKQEGYDVEAVAAADEVFIKLPDDRVQPCWRFQHPRADAFGEVLQHEVIVFVRKGDPQQPSGSGRQQQWSDCGIDCAVSDVEQIAGLGIRFEAGMQALEMVLVDGEVRREVRCHSLSIGVSIRG